MKHTNTDAQKETNTLLTQKHLQRVRAEITDTSVVINERAKVTVSHTSVFGFLPDKPHAM